MLWSLKYIPETKQFVMKSFWINNLKIYKKIEKQDVFEDKSVDLLSAFILLDFFLCNWMTKLENCSPDFKRYVYP